MTDPDLNVGRLPSSTVSGMSTAFDLAHWTDTHVGFTQYPVTHNSSGRPQRELDVLRAFVKVAEDITAWDPPISIHAGDVADKAVITYRHQLIIKETFRKLSVRKDGSQRINIVISGNHDQPRATNEPCFLEPTLRYLPGVVVVTSRYEAVDLRPYVERGEADESLRDVVVHCIPHDQLKRESFDEITPWPGRTNILVTHGVVGGSELYKRAVGREYAIPTDVIARDWDYVALGHWHKRTPVSVSGRTDVGTSHIWYAGSPENMSFRDLKDNVDGRGYLRVRVNPGAKPDVTPVDLPIRAMFRLPALDATGMTFEEITAALKARVRDANITGAVVGQRVEGVSRDIWSLVDIAAVKGVAEAALWYEVTPVFTRPAAVDGEPADGKDELGDLASMLATRAAALCSDDERDAVLDLARKLLGSALADTPTEDGAGPDPTPDPDPSPEPVLLPQTSEAPTRAEGEAA